VREGKINAGAALSFQGGRVSVQGVQGVMMINGILARMIFEANKWKHAFYVEESYVIPWMYPYLEPHGLIMKINREKLPRIPQETVENDTAFWDWYTARLMSNNKFKRDVVARKTFSKLRSAIAGLYSHRGLFPQAEHAFRQALELYPLSPEANFRLAELLMKQRRFTDARVLIEEFLIEDPGNDKVESFLNQVRTTEEADAKRETLEKRMETGGDIRTALELIQVYMTLRLGERCSALTRSVLANDLPPNQYLAIDQVMEKGGRNDLRELALSRYLEKQGANPKVWIDLAAVQAALKKTNECLNALRRAIQLGGEPVRDVARRDTRFDPVRESAGFQELVPPVQAGFPMGLQGF
jgi:tetratricopeptide (TPR) repeat protein